MGDESRKGVWEKHVVLVKRLHERAASASKTEVSCTCRTELAVVRLVCAKVELGEHVSKLWVFPVLLHDPFKFPPLWELKGLNTLSRCPDVVCAWGVGRSDHRDERH
jgi:hypothetical protein